MHPRNFKLPALSRRGLPLYFCVFVLAFLLGRFTTPTPDPAVVGFDLGSDPIDDAPLLAGDFVGDAWVAPPGGDPSDHYTAEQMDQLIDNLAAMLNQPADTGLDRSETADPASVSENSTASANQVLVQAEAGAELPERPPAGHGAEDPTASKAGGSTGDHEVAEAVTPAVEAVVAPVASAARDSQAQPAPAGSVVAHRVASGDNLTKILRQHGVRDLAVTVVELLRDKRSRSRLSTLRSGEELFIRQHEGALVELSMDSSAGEAMVMKRNSKGRFYPVFEAKETETVIRVVAGQVQRGVFFDSAVQAGLSASMVQGLVRHLEWRVDFGKDIRNGDRFRVLLKEVVAGGQAVSPAQAVAVQYQGARVSVTLYRHMDGQFYTEDGETGALAFLRKPVLEYRRISSGFSPNRKHPITGRTAPHNGVDFSGPVGTPVLAAADGEVVEARYKRLNGNFIRIKHGKYQTYYLHLSDMAVTKGQRVRRGQVIGSLGNTGRSTGPHLHFEIHENGVPKNPLTMPLPASKDLEQLMAEGFIERLARYQSHLG